MRKTVFLHQGYIYNMKDKDKTALIKKSNDAWRQLSSWWDENIEDGDPFHHYLIFPGMLELVNCQAGTKILDLACGNGTLARRFAALGASVLGTDISETFIEQAKVRSKGNIRYQVLDATAATDLQELAKREQFDVVVCSMALHDLPTITPLIKSLASLLHKDGKFVFSVPHPCFNMGEIELNFFAEKPSLTRHNYIKPVHLEMKSKPGQPVNQHCFHRSLTDMFGHFFKVGMLLDALIEPSLSTIEENLSNVNLDWKLLPEIPPALLGSFIFK